MSRPEIKDLNRRYADVIRQLDGMDGSDVIYSAAEYRTKEELLEERGKIEHWLWMLDSE